ncbi:MAG: hypothetical protein P4N59_16555 [Negativicutes bacterium]|nr:hypothetical protein [Negativicutes bacterium]
MSTDRHECHECLHEEIPIFLVRIEGQLHRIEELLEAILRELRED